MTAALAPIWSDEDALGQNLPETPAPATGWPQEDWGPRLAAYAAGLDSGFVRGGEILVGAIDTIYAMFDGLDKLAEVLNPQSVGASVNALRGAAGHIAGLPGQLAQLFIDLHQRFADELHAAVRAGQAVQNGLVKHEHAMHLLAAFERVKQRRVVKRAQVAAKPHQTFVDVR